MPASSTSAAAPAAAPTPDPAPVADVAPVAPAAPEGVFIARAKGTVKYKSPFGVELSILTR